MASCGGSEVAKIGLIPQNPFGALHPTLRLERQFRKALSAHGAVSRSECDELALNTLKRLKVAGPERVLRGYAHELSGGMAQRVVIAIVMALNPSLIIADEPTTGLDVTVQLELLDVIAEMVAEQERSMLLITHDLGIVGQYCERVMVMYAGKLVEVGRVREVFNDPAHPYTEALLASSPRPGHEPRWLEGRVPDLIHYPTGCPFRARCDYADDVCGEAPELLETRDGRLVSCHFPRGVSESVPRTP